LAATPKHKDRLTAVDASFLVREAGTHMHIGGVLVFEGPPPAREDFEEHVSSRLRLVPRYRQKLAHPRLEMGRPMWIDDPSFNLVYHVRHSALPSPGSEHELRQLVGRIFSQRLDRSKPLWEIWLVEGFERDRFAVISKVHHSLVDGVSGVDLTTVMFDTAPEGTPDLAADEPWRPNPEPSDRELVAEGIKGLVKLPFGLARKAASMVAHPSTTLGNVREAAEGMGEVVWSMVNPAPKTPLNGNIGTHRRVLWVETSLADLKDIKDGLGGTVNDVFLTVVASALQKWLHSRGIRTEGLQLRGCVPVSIRPRGEESALGNRITMMMGPLPVYAKSPRERYRIVRESMAGLKESKQAQGAEMIANLQDFAPPTILAQASRLNFSNRFYNLLVTNVPGPQFPIYLLGRELLQLRPVAFLAPRNSLAVAIMSYNGSVFINLIGDYDAMPDLDRLAEYVQESIDELSELAAEAAPRRPAARASRNGSTRARRAPKAQPSM
jgi:WS/DGAT/MGAT family acyltransferase